MKRDGFTLVELLVTLALIAIVMGGVGNMLWQMWVIPSQGSGILTSLSELRYTSQRLQEDALRADFAWTGLPPYYIHFVSLDYSTSPVRVTWIDYYFSAGTLWRQETTAGSPVLTQEINRHIAQYSDISFYVKNDQGLIRVNIKETVDALPHQITREATLYLRNRRRPPYSWVIFAGARGENRVIDWKADGGRVSGDIHSNSDIRISGSGNRYQGIVEASQDIVDAGIDNAMAQKILGAPEIWPLPIYDTSAITPTFFWEGDVNLAFEPDVWEDYPRNTQLKPGVYMATGRLQLPGYGVTGQVTFIAEKVEILARNVNLTPYLNHFLIYATGSQAKLSGDNNTYTGVIYTPRGEIRVSGRASTVNGILIGDTVKVKADDIVLQPW